MSANTAKIEIDGTTYELPIVVGTEGEKAIDISQLRAKTGCITLDDGYANTGSCKSKITFIDGEEGTLRYRGIPIEELAERASFVETAWLLIFGELPNTEQREHFRSLLTKYSALPTAMLKHFDAFPANSNPMAIMSAMINSLSMHERPLIVHGDEEALIDYAARLISKVRTIAAAAYKSSRGEPIIQPKDSLKYVDNFLHMMFSKTYDLYEPLPEVSQAINQFLVLHADHEQNCSTSTVRMVASGQANMYAACSAGVVALWGQRHGGANVAVVQMLQRMLREHITPKQFLEEVKKRENGSRLMGFGHRVYKNMDPRAKILRKAAGKLLNTMESSDPLLELAEEVAAEALADDYFIERSLYPNVDFYSGIILRAVGIPLNMFTVMFAIGRMPGWIANWKEINDNTSQRIYRPRQLYIGKPQNHWVQRNKRG
ncbi:citrate synthase [Propionimicrobium lymphophilum]|uniref:Citrate synthase n=1 Tax=Propionimicrobium lymphophilum ACS-093-V-SCH5 TaxID=883161 RepID=S2X260_9ACTN|nr:MULTISPECIES: citrate synthase [Propionimicrobium]EPD34089.1 citrate (Si)-synthase [Propionimicrobium lymphophilum ACS-093-V-SCH5]ETJ97578.1 putative citrate (Si)-synthase [Propionimicrobium sp. BV2F7]MDK7710399.1 citrate synthase [Propionimicrobium lymphophilum]MDK7733751.1 citrate synthase [Propionimicrobium lymphophilum]